jgi:2-polyprenyl-3-methyl-5-hydroxy-6-metoxy-1,4-benzoquinol methylase
MNIKNPKKEFYDNKHLSEYGKKAVYLNPNPDHYHQKIIELIKNSGSSNLKILDVGCASGYLGAAIKSLGEHTVFGIEISEVAVKKAKKVLDVVICGDIESINLPWNIMFDYIILADVLEHLFDPKSVLIKLKDYLKSEGILLSTIPNIAYYANRLMLLKGDWKYEKTGSLDYGHLKKKKKNRALLLFEKTGYNVINVIPWTPIPNVMIHKQPFIFIRNLLTSFDSLFAKSFLYVVKND